MGLSDNAMRDMLSAAQNPYQKYFKHMEVCTVCNGIGVMTITNPPGSLEWGYHIKCCACLGEGKITKPSCLGGLLFNFPVPFGDAGFFNILQRRLEQCSFWSDLGLTLETLDNAIEAIILFGDECLKFIINIKDFLSYPIFLQFNNSMDNMHQDQNGNIIFTSDSTIIPSGYAYMFNKINC